MRLRARYSICSLPAEISLARKTSRLADVSIYAPRSALSGWSVKNCQHPAKERVIDALR
jgi:hypothetical protein